MEAHTSPSKGDFQAGHPRLLPPYIKPFPEQFPHEAVQYLQGKGALDLPSDSLRNQLLQSYIEFVHGLLPILELHNFLNMIEGGGKKGHISLLLFQAVMFAGTAFVDMQHLRTVGFKDRRDARNACYEKVRLLYEFDYENDTTSAIQSLLLLTYWHEIPSNTKDLWHWMGIAISLATILNVPQDPRLWKRIKWCCLVRDRLVALAMGRPTRVDESDFDVPRLTLEDFELEPVAIEISCVPPECKIARDKEMLRHLAHIFIAKTKLCQCLGRILAAHYSPRKQFLDREASEGRGGWPTTLLPKSSALEVAQSDKDLLNWKNGLDEVVIFVTPTLADLAEGKTSLVINRALLHLLYLAGINTLHRPGTLLQDSINASGKLPQNYINSCKKVHQSAVEITRTVQDLRNLDLIRFLPATGVTVLMPALTTHIVGMKLVSAKQRMAALERFNNCMHVMQSLSDIYAAADIAADFLTVAIQKVISQGGSGAWPKADQHLIAKTFTSSLEHPIGLQFCGHPRESSPTVRNEDEERLDSIAGGNIDHMGIDSLLSFGFEVDPNLDFEFGSKWEPLERGNGKEEDNVAIDWAIDWALFQGGPNKSYL